MYGTYLPAFELLLHTGLRRGDPIALPWKNVKFDLNVITLRAGKNSAEVKIPIHNDLFPVLRAEYERQTKVLGSRPKDSSPVLLNPETGDPYSRSGLNRALEGWGRRTEIDEVRPHRFRCTFAVHCLLKGLDVRRVATLLGDKVQTVVDHYLPMSKALAQQAADILNPRASRAPRAGTRSDRP